MKYINIAIIFVALTQGLLFSSYVPPKPITMPNLIDVDGITNFVKAKLAGYSQVSGGGDYNYNWQEFDNGNGAICSPEYIAYNLKHLDIADGQTNIVRLKGGTPYNQEPFSYVVASYSNDGQNIRGGYLCNISRNADPKNLSIARVVACLQNYQNGNPNTPILPLIKCGRGEGFKAYSKNAPETWFTNAGTSFPFWGFWNTVQFTQPQINKFLSEHLSTLAQMYMPLTREIGRLLAINQGPMGSTGLSGSTNYNTIQKTAFTTPTPTGFSVGYLGHYNFFINNLLANPNTLEGLFPTSDTSDVMFGKPSSSFSNHALYLMFAANMYSKNQIERDQTSRTFIALTVLLHRYLVLKDIVNTENWKQNSDAMDVYELLAIIKALLPNFTFKGTPLPDLSQWNSAQNAGNALEALSDAQTSAISHADNVVDNNVPTEIKDLHAIQLDGNNNIYPYEGTPLINFKQNGNDMRLFDWKYNPL